MVITVTATSGQMRLRPDQAPMNRIPAQIPAAAIATDHENQGSPSLVFIGEIFGTAAAIGSKTPTANRMVQRPITAGIMRRASDGSPKATTARPTRIAAAGSIGSRYLSL